MHGSDIPASRPDDPVIGRRFTLRDTALVATIPALYLGAFALRFWHVLP